MENRIQKASRDINNVAGNQNIFNFNNAVFKVDEKLNNAITLEKIPYVNYWEVLKNSIISKKIITRNYITKEINTALEKFKSILIYGEPGIGKTTLITNIEFKNKVIYISLKDRTLEDVFLYVINSYEIPFDSQHDMFFTLEGFMKSSNHIFIFDDCESNKEIVKKLNLLEKFDNKFVFLSRDMHILKGNNIFKYRISEMSKEEVKAFIELHIKELNNDTINELYLKSKGNPLYLYYYVNYRIHPLPSGLENYQEALWESLDIQQREILTCISITNFPIRREVLKSSVSEITSISSTLMEFQLKISSIEYLLSSHKNKYSVFHPLFKEYIVDYLESNGLRHEYERIVGKNAISNDNIIEGTLLLLDKDIDAIIEYLLHVGIQLYNYSNIPLSIKVLEQALESYRCYDEYKEYYAHSNYHISQIYREINEKYLGDRCIEEAIKVYKELDNEIGYVVSLLFKAVFLAEDGKKAESENLLEEINRFKFEDENIKGCIYMNLSKINLTFNQYEIAALNAKLAYESFIKIDNIDGATKSLLNYSAALANIDKEDLATVYLENILENRSLRINKNMRASIMNNLTSCYRKNKQYDKAIEYCNKSIKISKELNQPYKVVMNMLNLGNVYRDLKQFDMCKSIYLEAIAIADKNGITREIGRGNELIASTYYLENQFDKCIEFAEKAIKSSSLANDDFRVAEAYIEMSRAYLKLELIHPYINCLEEAIKYYKKENFFNECLENTFKLVKYYSENSNSNKIDEHLKVISTLLMNNNENINYHNLYYDLMNNLEISTKREIIDVYYSIIIGYINSDMSVNLHNLFIEFMSVCVLKDNDNVKYMVKNIINKLILKGKQSNRAYTILAFVIEQSGELIDLSDLEDIIDELVDVHDDVFIRKVGTNAYILTDYWNEQVYLQYMCDTNKLINLKIALALYLLLKFNKNHIIKYTEDIRCKYLDFNIMDYETTYKVLVEQRDFLDKINFEEMPVSITRGTTSDVTTFILLGKEYEVRSSHSEYKHNKVFIYIIMMIFINVLARLNNIEIKKADALYSKRAREFIESLIWVNLKQPDSKWVIEGLFDKNIKD